MGIPNTSIQYHTVQVSRYNTAEANMFDADDQPIPLNLSEDVVPEDPTSYTELRHQAFLGWAENGDITGNLLYVNYAHRSDFEALQSLGINLTGAIGIARYGGGMFRGVKADQADQFGLLGLILYSDPEDDGFGRGEVFPDGVMYFYFVYLKKSDSTEIYYKHNDDYSAMVTINRISKRIG